MNPIVRHLILNKVRAFVKARKENKMKNFDPTKSIQKFIEGAGVGLVATILALLLNKDAEQTKLLLTEIGKSFIVIIPLVGGLINQIRNAIKFFSKNKEE
jgi:hypothetical protein